MVAPWVVAIIVNIVLTAAAYALMPRQKPPNAEAGKLEVPTAEEGSSVPVVYGTVTMKSPNIVDYFRSSTIPIQSEGGKK